MRAATIVRVAGLVLILGALLCATTDAMDGGLVGAFDGAPGDHHYWQDQPSQNAQAHQQTAPHRRGVKRTSHDSDPESEEDEEGPAPPRKRARAERETPLPMEVTPPASAAPTRVVAFADLHGDIVAAEIVHELLNVYSDVEKTRTTVVSTGDFVDRGPDDINFTEATPGYLVWNFMTETLPDMGFADIRYTTGNHEMMMAGGDWRYRNMFSIHRAVEAHDPARTGVPRDQYEQALLQQDKEQTLACSGTFNTFVRNVQQPIHLVTSPAHDETLLFAHGGVTTDLLAHTTTGWPKAAATLENAADYINARYRSTGEAVCRDMGRRALKGGQTVLELFAPAINDKEWDSAVNRGEFETNSRHIEGAGLGWDKRWQESLCGGEKCATPVWDRSYYEATIDNKDKGRRDACRDWMGVRTDRAGRGPQPAVRQFLGHTNEESPPRSACGGMVFGLDTSMSRGICSSTAAPCPFSVLVLENFGTPDWVTRPVIVRKYVAIRDYADWRAGAVVTCERLVSTQPTATGAEDRWAPVRCDDFSQPIAGADAPDRL